MDVRARLSAGDLARRLALIWVGLLMLLVMGAAPSQAHAALNDGFKANVTVGGNETPCDFIVVEEGVSTGKVRLTGGYFSAQSSPTWFFTGTPAVSPYVSGELVVPQTVVNNGITYTVTGIEPGCFYGCTGITSVSLPSTMTSIASGAFYGCSGIDSLSLPSSVTTIGDYAFKGCSGIGSVTMPGVTSIGAYAFWYDHGITQVDLPSTLDTIAEGAFNSCTGLTQVSIPASVDSLGDGVFVGCTALQTASFVSDSPITTLSASLFSGCTNLSALEVPAGLEGIGSQALSGTALTTFTIPAAMTEIPDYAFSGTGLASITIPSTVTSIGIEAFKDCKQLRSVTFDGTSTLKTVGASAFEGCSGIKSLRIPDSVTTINSKAFYACSGLTSLVLPTNLTSIPNAMAGSCTALVSITIPATVTEIGGGAFSWCTALTSVTIPAGTSSVGSFNGCHALTSLTLLGDTTKSMSDGVIEDTGIVGGTTVGATDGYGKIYVPANKLAAYQAAATTAGENWGKHLASVATKPADTHVYALLKADNTLVECTSSGVEVKGGHVYDTSSEYSDYKRFTITNVFFANGITQIGSDDKTELFYNSGAITSVTIPASVTSIGKGAFRWCWGLQSVTFASGSQLASVGDSAFDSCMALRSVALPDTAALFDYAFYGCSALETANIPTVNTSVKSYLFYNDYLLGAGTDGTIAIPQNIADHYGDIESYAFDGCRSLTSVNLPTSTNGRGIYTIAECAFLGSGLTSVTIPADVTYVKASAFGSCNQLRQVTWNATKATATVSSVFSDDKALASVTFGDGMESGELGGLFSGCSGLSQVSIPGGVTGLYDTFSECTALKSVVLPDGMQTLSGAFKECTALSQVNIPNGTDSLSSAFLGCSALASVSIPESATSLGSAFQRCSALAYVEFAGTPQVTTIGEYCFNRCRVLPSITLPLSVTTIDDRAFSMCEGLTYVGMPALLADIGDYAFTKCYSLPLVTIPDTVNWIGEGAFFNCTSLTSLTLPQGIATVNGALCGGDEKLGQVVIPAGVTSFAACDNGVPFQDCTSLTTVIFENDCAATEYPESGYELFSGCTDLATVVYRDKKQASGAISYGGLSPQFYYSVNYYRNIDDATAKTNRIGSVAVKMGTRVDGTAAPDADDTFDGTWEQASTFEQDVNVATLDDSCWAIPQSWKGLVITTQPASSIVGPGTAVTLTIAAQIQDVGGTQQAGTISYQWYGGDTPATFDMQPISGATQASYVTPTTLANGSHYYFCKVSSDAAGLERSSLDSDVAVVTVKAGVMSVDPASWSWDLYANYDWGREEKRIRITNTSDVTITGVKYSLVTDGGFYVAGTCPSLDPGESSTGFYMRPADELAVGMYSGTLTITADNALDVTIPLAATIKPLTGAKVSVSPTSLDFGSVKVGSSAPTGKTVRITNTGTINVGINPPALSNYSWSWAYGKYNVVTLAPKAYLDVTVTPYSQEEAGTYDETLELVTDACGTFKVPLSFAVTEAGYAGAPGSFTAKPGDSKATLSWKAPSDNGGTPITGYVLQYSTNEDFSDPVTVSPAPAAAATKATVTGLTNGTACYFRIWAVNSKGQSTVYVQATTTPAKAPNAPTGLTGEAQDGGTSMALSWTAPASDGGSVITGYKVYRSATQAGAGTLVSGSTPILATTWTDAGLKPNTSYWYTVKAVNAVGESVASNVATVKTKQASIAGATIAAIPDQAYTGKAIAPALTVTLNGETLVAGTDYDVDYGSANVNVGTVTVSVVGKGNYTGTKAAQFKITPAVTRLWGDTALDTMAKVTADWSAGSCSTVIVATMDGYWDALSASALAGMDSNRCPVLITSGSSLSQQARSEIVRLGVSRVFIAGGTAAVSQGVENSIKAISGVTKVTRLAGSNAVDTALKVYAQGKGSWGTTAIIATNGGYWDALAASPYAYAKHAPIFLYNSGTGRLDDSVVAALRDGGFTKVMVCGGKAAVSGTVEGQLKGLGSITSVKRYGGATAVETSALIAQACIDAGMTCDGMAVATNDGYWDALTGAAFCGINNAPLVLASDSNRSAITGFIASHKRGINQAYVFGGTAAVSAGTYDALVAALK